MNAKISVPRDPSTAGYRLDPRSDGSGRVLVSVVVPVFMEEANIRPLLARLEPVLETIGPYEIIFCLDPCRDRTEAIIREEIGRNPRIGSIVFSRRFGQPAATMAGILNCRGDWCVVIDADLQDPPELISTLLAKAREGYDVVAARRISRQGETLVKKAVSALGYALINQVAHVTIPPNTGDFRIMSRRVVEELRGLKEAHGFLRGLVALTGFRQTEIEYEREARYTGRGNYNRYLGSLKIGLNGLLGFSAFPLQLMMWSGFGMALVSAVLIVVVVVLNIIHGNQYPMGIPTIQVLVLFIGGVQLAAIGVLGEYVSRIYDEVRARPLYAVEKAVNVRIRDSHGPGSGLRPFVEHEGRGVSVSSPREDAWPAGRQDDPSEPS
jgi:dolichol-phosphate mannosyltransferase